MCGSMPVLPAQPEDVILTLCPSAAAQQGGPLAPIQWIPADGRTRRAAAWRNRKAHRWNITKVAHRPRYDATQQVMTDQKSPETNRDVLQPRNHDSSAAIGAHVMYGDALLPSCSWRDKLAEVQVTGVQRTLDRDKAGWLRHVQCV